MCWNTALYFHECFARGYIAEFPFANCHYPFHEHLIVVYNL